MFQYLLVFIFLFNHFKIVTAQAPLPADGKCPTFKNCTDKDIKFVPRSITGYRYLVSSVPYFFQADRKCTWYNFTETSNTTMLVELYETDIETNKLRKTDGVLEYRPDGKVFVNYTNLELPLEFKAVRITPEYFIYLVCNECGFFSKTGAGIYAYGFSNIPWPSCEVIEAINRKFEECGIDKKYIKIQNQDGCTKCR